MKQELDIEQEYEIALSYSHEDLKIATELEKELKYIFADKFFMDHRNPEELANASDFKEKLRNIFYKAHYSIILYSENYGNKEFTKTEKEAILEKIKTEPEPHLFIININDLDIKKGFPQEPTYILIKVKMDKNENKIPDSSSKEETIDWRKQLCTDIHNRIKLFMIKQSINERKQKNEYSLNIQTLFTGGADAIWEMDYDWNILGKKYINKTGREIKDETETSWEEFWKYIQKDFLSIKRYLNDKPDITRKIRFHCHLSIAYKLGQLYGDLGQGSGNRNLILLSSNRDHDAVFTLEKEKRPIEITDFIEEYPGNTPSSPDIICIISIKPKPPKSIRQTVENSMQGQEYRKVYVFQKDMLIEDTNVLESMADYLRNKMTECRTESTCKIHLFPDTTVPLMFLLGARSIFPGEIQLYEYLSQKDSYIASLTNEITCL